MIDSHCHLTDPRLASQLDDVLARARANGVTRMITIGTDLADARRAIDLCAKVPAVRCAIGVHPNHSHEIAISDLPALRTLAADPAVLALGEMGLDYFHKFAPREQQRAVFEFQLQLATELGLPVVIHSREAVEDTLDIMAHFPAIRAVFHCFTGTRAQAMAILNSGYFLGFTGPITYKKNDDLREVVKLTPDDRLVVETDAPYLTPEPMRKQKTNEPGFVRYVGQMVAQMKGWTLEDADRVTSANVETLFGWKR